MRYWIMLIMAIATDQGSKWIVEQKVSLVDTIPLIKNVFHLTYSRNTGAAFSILRNQQMLLIVVTSAVMIFLLLWLAKLTMQQGDYVLKTALVLVLAGGIGNLIDRIRLNYVIDFLDFRLIHYPIFNVADCCIVIGTILLAWQMLFQKTPA